MREEGAECFLILIKVYSASIKELLPLATSKTHISFSLNSTRKHLGDANHETYLVVFEIKGNEKFGGKETRKHKSEIISYHCHLLIFKDFTIFIDEADLMVNFANSICIVKKHKGYSK